MANTDLARGFTPFFPAEPFVLKFNTAASYAGQKGDLVTLDTAARTTATFAAKAVAGVQAGGIEDATTGLPNATAAADDFVAVYCDPWQKYKAQIAGTVAAADPYTTRSAAAAFDHITTAGSQEVDADNSSNDIWKICGFSTEFTTGQKSSIDSNAKAIVQLNTLIHYMGTGA